MNLKTANLIVANLSTSTGVRNLAAIPDNRGGYRVEADVPGSGYGRVPITGHLIITDAELQEVQQHG